MIKARKAALDWLPKRKDGRKRYYQCNDDDVRGIYAKAYRKAKKELELSWEDMMIIHRCIKDAMNYHLYKMMEGVEGQKTVYQEVLKRFKSYKETKNP